MCESSVFSEIAHFLFKEGKLMRIILDTDKKTITVPHNYQQKLNDMNKLIAEYSDGKKDPETFTGYINKIWQYCIENSDQCVMTGKKPTSMK